MTGDAGDCDRRGPPETVERGEPRPSSVRVRPTADDRSRCGLLITGDRPVVDDRRPNEDRFGTTPLELPGLRSRKTPVDCPFTLDNRRLASEGRITL